MALDRRELLKLKEEMKQYHLGYRFNNALGF